MKILKNRIATIAISIFFILSIAGSMLTISVKGAVTALPGVSEGGHIPTFLYLVVGPNPIGVGQTVTANAFFGSNIIDTEIPSAAHPQNYNVTVTTPSGSTTSLTLAADKTGGGYATYVPTTVGTYKFQAHYGGQAFARPGWIGFIQDPADSPVETLIVQQAPITERAYPFTPLPTSWWQTPVSAENTQNWWQIMGPQLFPGTYNSTTLCNPYTEPVLSGHVLWTKPWIAGGVAGGPAAGPGEQNGAYWTVRQYEQPYNPIIISGRMWAQQQPQSGSSNNGILCVDLYTGETIYRINTTSTPSMGLQTPIFFPNGYGAVQYVIFTTGSLTPAETGGHLIVSTGTQANMYDGLTGIYICSIVNGTSPSQRNEDANGNIIGYYQNATAGYQSIWTQKPFNTLQPDGSSVPGTPQLVKRVAINSTAPALCKFNYTKCLWNAMSTSGGLQIGTNTAIDFRLGIEYVKSIPTTLDGKAIYPVLGSLGGANLALCGDQIILNSYIYPTFYWTNGWEVLAAFNKDTGALTWIKNYTYPTYPWLLPWQDTWSHGLSMNVNGLMIQYEMHNWNIQALDSNTGNVVWTTQLKAPWGDGAPNVYSELASGITSGMNWNGQWYVVTFGGEIWDVNVADGRTIWYTNTTNLMGPSGIETPYNIWPIWTAQNPQIMAPGVLYLGDSHQYNPPLFHGAQLIAVNATDGSLLWKELNFPMPGQGIAYGVLLHLNGYDGQIWAYGKGPSAVTVTAPDIGVTTDTPIRIRGTVMDVSAGTLQDEQKFAFPYGVPCVSEASQSAFMEYVYENQAEPTNTTGVPVTLTETDHNGNTYTIGTTRTDASGTFGFTWTPPIEGNYTIIATFAGSNSYYGQCAETSIETGPAAATTAPTTAPVQGFATTGDLNMAVAIIAIIVIVIGAVLALLMMRKRP